MPTTAAEVLTALGDVQIPLLAAMLLGGAAAKLGRAVRRGSVSGGFGPTALFPLRLRGWASGALCAVELVLGIGLILTSGRLLSGAPAELFRLGAGVLFMVATSALIEIRSIRPGTGCGCFGDLSTVPITGRTLVRAALLAVAALAIIRLPAIKLPQTPGSAALPLLFLAVEVGLFAALSPEVRALLIRIGYSTPCELQVQPPEQALARLRRSAQWRRHEGLIADEHQADIWRELCWHYVAYPSRYPGRRADLVFAVYLEHRRPMVRAALVDSATGEMLPWPTSPARPPSLKISGRPHWLAQLPGWRPAIPLPRPPHGASEGERVGQAAALPLTRAGHAGSDRSAGQ